MYSRQSQSFVRFGFAVGDVVTARRLAKLALCFFRCERRYCRYINSASLDAVDFAATWLGGYAFMCNCWPLLASRPKSFRPRPNLFRPPIFPTSEFTWSTPVFQWLCFKYFVQAHRKWVAGSCVFETLRERVGAGPVAFWFVASGTCRHFFEIVLRSAWRLRWRLSVLGSWYMIVIVVESWRMVIFAVSSRSSRRLPLQDRIRGNGWWNLHIVR